MTLRRLEYEIARLRELRRRYVMAAQVCPTRRHAARYLMRAEQVDDEIQSLLGHLQQNIAGDDSAPIVL